MDGSRENDAMNDELLDAVSGGREDDTQFIISYFCSHCRYPNIIKQVCRSGKTKWTCGKCGQEFTIWF